MTNCHGGLGRATAFVSHKCSQFLTIPHWKKQTKTTQKEDGRMYSAVPIDHTSKWVEIMRGKRIWSNIETSVEEEDGVEKNLIEQKAQPTVALSHRNKSSAKRQLWKWAGLAALRQQFAENWTMLSMTACWECVGEIRGEGGSAKVSSTTSAQKGRHILV